MHATLRYYGNTGLADALAARGDEVKAVVSAVPGFRAYYLIRTDDSTVSVTVCDDEAGVEETNRAAADWIRENMPEAAADPPRITAGEIVLSS